MRRVALLFPGQGSQYIGMGKDMLARFEIAANLFAQANDILEFDLKRMIDEGDTAELALCENAQPAVVTMGYCMFQVYLQEFGVEPCYLAGHSLGEVTALIAAGAMSFGEGVDFARTRGRLMHQASLQKKGRVALIIGASDADFENELLASAGVVGSAAITAYNSPDQLLVAAKEEVFAEIERVARRRGYEFVPFSMLPMKIDAPYHSVLMADLAADIAVELASRSFAALKWQVVSNVSALPYESHRDIVGNLSKQVTHPVKWRQSIRYMQDMGVQVMIDVGPNYVIKDLVSACCQHVDVFALDVQSDYMRLKQELRPD